MMLGLFLGWRLLRRLRVLILAPLLAAAALALTHAGHGWIRQIGPFRSEVSRIQHEVRNGVAHALHGPSTRRQHRR